MTINPLVLLIVGGCVTAALVIMAVALVRSGPSGGGGSVVNLSTMITWLQGKKTVIGIVAIAINNYAARRGWIDLQLANDLNYALGTGTALAFVAKTNRIEQKQDLAAVKSDTVVDAATDAATSAQMATQTIKAAFKLPVTPISVADPTKPSVTPGSVL